MLGWLFCQPCSMQKRKALKHFNPITNGAHDWITRPHLFVIDIIIPCDSYQLVMRIAKVGFFFFCFSGDGLLSLVNYTNERSNQTFEHSQNRYLYCCTTLLLGLLMWVQEENFLGKGYGIKCVMWCYWEHIGNLLGTWGTNEIIINNH
jgi:hypothetical protein